MKHAVILSIAILMAALVSGCVTSNMWRNKHKDLFSEETTNSIIVGFLKDDTVAVWSGSGRFRDLAVMFKLQDAKSIPAEKVKSISIVMEVKVDGNEVYTEYYEAHIIMENGINIMPLSIGIVRATPTNTIEFSGDNISHIRRYNDRVGMTGGEVAKKMALTPLTIGADAILGATAIATSPLWIPLLMALPSLKITNM